MPSQRHNLIIQRVPSGVSRAHLRWRGAKLAYDGIRDGRNLKGSPLPAVKSALPALIHIPKGDAGAPAWLAAISHF